MNLTSKQPNPKDFQDFEDYKKALKIHEEFTNKVNQNILHYFLKKYIW